MNQPAGVVHKGEVVWSQQDIARAGGVGVVEALRKGMKGYAHGGVVSIMPQVNAAMANMPSGGRGLTQVFQVNAQGAIMAEGLVSELKASGAQMAMQAGITAYGRAKADTMSDLSRRQEYSVR